MKIPFWPEFKGFRDIDLGLDRMYQALERLDNPHKKLPKTIHIAGTNGKGSSLAFLRSIFEHSGYKVHAYSSPHLVEFNERIYLSGENISDDFLNQCLQECKDSCEQEPKISLTFFEGTTLAAFLAFSRVEADILILETGMGGRLDATNVLDKVLASIITPISIDHAEFLGDNVEKIAFEKAGILKESCLAICSKQDPKALDVIREKSNELNCKFLAFGDDFNIDRVLEFDAPKYLKQKHQIENLASVLAFIEAQNEFKFDLESINRGIVNAKWPARLEKIEKGRFFSENYDLFIDGGHNEDAALTVKDFLQENNKKFKIVIFSMLEDKNFKEYLNRIKDETDLLIACDIENSVKNRSKEEIFEFANEIDLKCIKSNLIEDAINDANKLINNEKISNPLILVAGSLYLAGNFIEQNK